MLERRTILWGLLAGIAAISLLVACAGGPATTPPAPAEEEKPTKPAAGPEVGTELPAGDARALLEERCASCHTLDRVVQVRQSRDEWEQTLDRMITRGAQLNDEEWELLLDFLSENFGG